MCGIDAVSFYSTKLFMNTTFEVDPRLVTIIMGVAQVIGTLVASVVADRKGRRLLLITSAGVMSMCTTLLGSYFIMKDYDMASSMNIEWIPMVSSVAFIVAFSFGLGPVPWIMLGEIFSTDMKWLAGLPLTVNFALAFLVTKCYTNLRDLIGLGQTFFVFTGFSLLAVVFVYFIVPETKGKSLAEIQLMLAGSNKAKKSIDKEHR